MMECNRDEAVKAKNMAEKCMGNKDFTSARRFALKAQQLYPNLEDISKIVLVCDVLCSTNITVYRKEENDWYAILKIEPTADEATIRKQYRKFVLSLHPDKNKFAGASDAFRLVNEAHKTLLDRKLRLLYDLKLQAARSQVNPKVRSQIRKKSNTARYPQEQTVNENVAPQCKNQQDQQNQQSVDKTKTFWTACACCLMRFKYYEDIMGKQLKCRVCKTIFTALQETSPCPTDPSPQGEAASLNRQATQFTQKMFDPRVAVQRDHDNKKKSESLDGLTHDVSEVFNPKGKASNVESIFDKMGSAQQNSCLNKEIQRDGEDRHSEPNNGHIPPLNEAFKAKIGTSSNVESMSGEMGSAQENSCSKMELRRDGEDSHSEPNNGHIPFNESFKAKTGTSSNVESLYGKMASVQENLCSKMEFQRDGEDSPSEPNNGHIPPFNESFKAMSEKMASVQENSSSKMEFQRDGENSHLEPNNGHIPPFNESFKAKSGTSSNMESMSGEMGSVQENSCSKMKFQGDGEDNNSEANSRHIPPFDESFKANIGTSFVKSSVEGPANFDKLDTGIQKKRQRSGSISDCEENFCGNGANVRHKMFSTKESSTHKDNGIERAFQDNQQPVSNAQEFYEYPAPDFSNFNDLRARVFGKGQIWAVYDTLDSMPRFYALIREVFSPKLKVELVWLEPHPDDEEEIKWVEEGLPVSCGKFRYGNSDVIQELSVFSHQVYWEKGSTDGTFEVHPRKGETWALYKDWDISWHAHRETKKNFVYEFVEVLSDYANGFGVYVVLMDKVEGFSCIFHRATKGTMQSFLIPAKERFRFSHRVPSFKMSDKENKGILAGSFELDPASLPLKVEKANFEGNALKANLRKDRICEGDALGFVEVEGNPKVDLTSQDLRTLHHNSQLEFYNFQENICPNKFHIGQIWAIYCDEDALPRYYCKITRVDPSPIFCLYVRWFIACPPPEEMISWVDNEMLTAVGNYKLVKGRPRKYSSTDPFSHLVSAEPTDDKDGICIFPKKDQIWALYKNWNAGLNISNLDDCEYEIVRVVGENGLCILVSIMKPIEGFKSIFRPEVEGQPDHAVEISKTEILRFSHQIPAFQLTKEIGGSLQGFWELDVAALPRHLLNQ